MFVLTEMGICQPIVPNGACVIPAFIPSGTDIPVGQGPAGMYAATYQPAMSVQNSINCMTIPAGFSIEAWAHEGATPANGGVGIRAVQSFDFDEQGRVWAGETYDYPCSLTRNSDRIVRLADTDGNGAADQLTVIATGVTLVQGLVKVNGGFVIVNPQIQFRDETGGAAATWASPFDANAGRDTHGGSSELVYGIDNYIYGSNGYNSPFARIWRINALGTTHTYASFATSGCNNAHGTGQMEDGDIMHSSANGCPAQHAGMMGLATNNFGGNPTFHPATADVDQWDYIGQFTAASDANVYGSRLIPGWSSATTRRMFVCEGTGHLCSMWSLTANAATWSGAQSGTTPVTANIMAGADAWVAPIMAKTGPDGAVWVLDWYNRLFLHNPAGPSCGNAAYASALRTKTANRIYRIFPTGSTPEPILNLNTATEAQRIAALGNQNFHWRLAAQRLLIGGGATASLLTALEGILTTIRPADAIDNDPAATHAVWVLNGLGELANNPARWDPVLAAALAANPADVTRMNVMKAMAATLASANAIKAACNVTTGDANARVRFQSYQALTRMPAPTGGASNTNNLSTAGTFISTAYTNAGATKVTTGTCTVVPIRPLKQVGPFNSGNLRFHLVPGGFELASDGLESGYLVVYDMRGHETFRSTFNKKTSTWSDPVASGLSHPMYLYVFHPYNGDAFRGRLTMSQAL